MTLAINNNPFMKTAVKPIDFTAKKQNEGVETTGTMAMTNPINKPTLSTEQADDQMRKHSQAVTNYAQAFLAMGANNNNGMVGTETTGTAG